MPKNIIYILVFTAVIFSSCKKYLDKEPDNRTAVQTPEQIAQLLTTAYPKANYMLFCEAMTDNVEDKGGGGSGASNQDQINRQAYMFEEITVSPSATDGPDFYWNACYKAIAAANQALEYIAATADTASVAAHKGEALLARAYAHFMLVTLFAKTYDPSTAATNPGVPYVTETEKEIFKKYERKTVAYVYEMIEKDLVAGYPLISDDIYGSAPKFHFNRKAAAAFAARFYLFKGDYPKVINYATAAVGTTPATSMRPWNTTFRLLQYAELEAEYAKATTPGNLLLQETRSVWGRNYPFVRFGLGDQVVSSTLRYPTATGGIVAYQIYGTAIAYNIPKLYEFFVTETINANTGFAYNTIPLLTVEEALMNRAEAYVFSGQTDLAIADLNVFASQTIRNYNVAQHNLTQTKLSNYYQMSAPPATLNAIIDFKRMFFVHEGLRWFDILRFNIPVQHTTMDGEVVDIPADDNRRVLQLPVLTKQAGLEPNPR